MNKAIERIYQERLRAARYHRTGFTRPFSLMDLDAIQTWLDQECEAETPDAMAWKCLCTESYPFYKLPLSALLEGQTVQAILASADPIEDVEQLSIWNELDDGLRLLLERLDLSELAIFDARHPIFIDTRDIKRAYWLERKMENGYHGEWVMSRIPIGSDQVLSVLMQSWSQGAEKAENARTLCCNLLQVCLNENREQIQGTTQDEIAPPRAKTLP